MKFTLLQQKLLAGLLLIAYVNLLFGCQRYYRAIPVNAATTEKKEEELKKLNNEKKFFILRQGSRGYALSDVVLNQETMALTANLGQLSPQHQLYIPKKGKTKFTYSRAEDEEVVLQEVHIFTRDTATLALWLPHSIALSDITSIEVMNVDKKRTATSYKVGVLGIALGTALVVILIAAASIKEPTPPTLPDSSCPYVSSFDGKEYKLEGEIYSASIYPSLQKEDYLPLRIKPVDGLVKLKISNELQEIQHTDFADLVIVTHEAGTKVMVDPGGKFYTVNNEESAATAMLNNRTDIRGQLHARDENICLFKDDVGVRNTEEVFLSFENEKHQQKAKLVLSAKTSSWLNYLYGEFAKAFGNHYAKWTKQQASGDPLPNWSNGRMISTFLSQ